MLVAEICGGGSVFRFSIYDMIKLRSIYFCLTFIAALFSTAFDGSLGLTAAAKNSDDIFLECTVDNRNIYENQPIAATVWLYSVYPDIAFVNRIGEPLINNEPVESLRPFRVAGNALHKRIKGKDYYAFKVESFVFSLDGKGEYILSPSSYQIGIAEPVVINDPFWGPVKTNKTSKVELTPGNVKLKVKNIPDAPKGSNFSGAVGNFEIKAYIPKGDIYIGEEATACVVISGPGNIPQSVMPEYRSAFGSNVRLKSVSENRSEKIVDGKLVSELILDFTFIPESFSDSEIGPMSFAFFNPENSKFVTVRSDSVKVPVKSSTSKREKISI